MGFVRTLALGLMLLLLSTSAQAQGTPASNAFTFQGHLRYNGMPADVQLSATFRLFPTLNGTDDPVSDEITRTFTPDSEGRFSVLLDFGETFNGYRIFNGDERYMQIILLDPPGGLEEDIPLSPRARLAATPMAAYALNARITPLAEITDNHLVSTDELGSLSLNLDDDDLGLTIRPSGGRLIQLHRDPGHGFIRHQLIRGWRVARRKHGRCRPRQHAGRHRHQCRPREHQHAQ